MKYFQTSIVCLLSIFIQSNNVLSQELESSSTIKLKKNSNIKIAGRLSSGYYALLSDYREYKLIHYDNDLNILSMDDISCDNKDYEIIDMFQAADTMFMFYSLNNSGKNISFCLEPIKLNISEANAVKIGEISNTKRSTQRDFNISFSKNRDFTLISAIEKEGDNNGQFRIRLFIYNKAMELVNTKTLNIPYNYYDSYISSYNIDNNGKVYISYRTRNEAEKINSPGAYMNLIWKYDPTDGNFRSVPLKPGGYYLTAPYVKIDEKNRSLVAVGYFSDESFRSNEGIYYYNIDMESLEEKSSGFNPYDEKVYSKIMRRSRGIGGNSADNLILRDVILRSDGGAIVFSEIFYTTVVPSTSGNIYLPNTLSTITYYHYEEVLVSSLNPEGKSEWVNIIDKQQIYDDPGNQIKSFYVTATPEALYCSFNNDISRSNSLVQYEINPLGEIKTKNLFNEYAYISGIKEVGTKEIIIPAENAHYLKIYKLVY